MPNLTFVLPHWVYWSGLILIPLFSMVMVYRQKSLRTPPPGVSLSTAYMLWLTGGFVGIHRFYLRSALGVLYIPLFILILYGNVQERDARDGVSLAQNAILGAQFDVERAQSALTKGVEKATEKLAAARTALTGANDQLAASTTNFDFWRTFAGSCATIILALLLVDACLLPRLVRRRLEREGPSRPPESANLRSSAYRRPMTEDRGFAIRLAAGIDSMNEWVGHFVCYWSVIAVFVYYYEVLARYVFNSPTNWAHESMFLMFGMQYLISGGFAYREDAHVRVDVIYVHFSQRARAVIDILTSLFFFLFSGALLWTGWTFMRDAVGVWEVSFTEWAIQYWPVKSTIAFGALLILLQGASKLIKDVRILTVGKA
jgi:TRAP-type mannitol/chloroaromatic compound transport system permease small subunit